jgi:parvulin-like peptidyl-prolyl isomerase
LLTERIKEEKLRVEADNVFQMLKKDIVVQNIWADPTLRQQYPGVAARINSQQITTARLADECIARYGDEVLALLIQQKVLEQELRRRQVSVTQEEMTQEIDHAAVLAGIVDAQGRADRKRWSEIVTQREGSTWELYQRDAVWPSVALKKLTTDKIEITPEDLKKGFESNYGSMVRARAIVLNSQRRATEVWDQARTAIQGAGSLSEAAEKFGSLATEYSQETTSQGLAGQIPPIRRYSGQPNLEDEAFKLKAGELSGIIQVADRFVILFCEGYTDRVVKDEAEVRDILVEDLTEKKQRMAMAEKFEQLMSSAQIDNYLAAAAKAPSGVVQTSGVAEIHD